MNISKLCYAIWSWGTKTIEGTEAAYADVSKIGYKSVENVRHTIDAYSRDVKLFNSLYEKYGVKTESFFFGLPFKGQEDEFFKTLEKDLEFVAEAGINVRMIDVGFSEMNVIIGVNEEDFEKTIRVIHQGLVAK